MTTPLIPPGTPTTPAHAHGGPEPRPDTPRSIRIELVIVFAITLGMSGLSALVDLIETQIQASRAHQTLSEQSVSVAASQSDIDVIDLIRQLLSVTRLLAWGCLGLYLLWRAGVNLSERLGLNLRRTKLDLRDGLGLAALIGIPGLGLYLIAHALNLSVTVVGSSLTDTWWRIPVSVMLAIGNGFTEEILVIGYLLTRLEHLFRPSARPWGTTLRDAAPWIAVGIAAVLRGSYHLYQGYGAFFGNAAMGIVFGWVFLRWRRVWPLIIAHSIIDVIVLIAYPLLHGHVSWLP